MVSTSVFEHKDAEEQSTFMAGEFVARDLGHLAPTPPKLQPVRLSHTRGGRREAEFES
jgi:hypothetical protein